jgi:hypothetical protein
MVKKNVTQVAIGTQINWPTDTDTVPDVVIEAGRFAAITVNSTTNSVTGTVDLTGYSDAIVYLVATAAANSGGGVQYQHSPDGTNWTAATAWSAAWGVTAAGTTTRSLSNMRYVRFTMAYAGGGTDSLTAVLVVYAL